MLKDEDKVEEREKNSFEEAVNELDGYFITSKRRKLYKFVVNAVEKPLIESVLRKTRGNQYKAAQILGINRNTLHTKIKKLGINPRDCKDY